MQKGIKLSSLSKMNNKIKLFSLNLILTPSKNTQDSLITLLLRQQLKERVIHQHLRLPFHFLQVLGHTKRKELKKIISSREENPLRMNS